MNKDIILNLEFVKEDSAIKKVIGLVEKLYGDKYFIEYSKKTLTVRK